MRKPEFKWLFMDDGMWIVGFNLCYAAHCRAEYYTTRDEETTYQDEYDYALEDDCAEARDWLYDNMNPEDFPEDHVYGPHNIPAQKPDIKKTDWSHWKESSL